MGVDVCVRVLEFVRMRVRVCVCLRAHTWKRKLTLRLLSMFSTKGVERVAGRLKEIWPQSGFL